VFTAFPKARTTKIKEAYQDRHNQGFTWNNFMLNRWTDHEGNEQRVKDCYERNKKLIDLSQQPENIKVEVFQHIVQAQNSKKLDQVGVRFMKFCNRYGLTRLSEHPTDHARYLNQAYG
jgi:hypothetical protein